MDTQTFYPVFENGQVLTSDHLNDIVDYLEPQDRLTRSRLVGIGIVCGLEPDWDAKSRTLTLSHGVAVTSEGYLIAEDAVVLDRFRPYTVPIPSGSQATTEDKAKARYPFLFDGSAQRTAFELLPTDFQPAPGEADPTALTSAFVADKTVMLFLECNVEALKNCDVNDCSDKGSEMNLTLRRLLVTQDIADKMLAQEADIAGRPVDRANHPRLGLTPIAIEKINPALHEIATLSELYGRFLTVAGGAGQRLIPAMREAWAAYEPLLSDMFPKAQFPDGPIPDHHFVNPLAAFAETPALAQYLFDATHDMVRSHNEFIDCAARFDAECCPDPGRFPKHVLAGDVLPRPTAFVKAPRTAAEYAAYDPFAAAGGPAPEGVPAERRHHFVPSPALDAGSDKVAELRSIFARMVLLAQTYATRGLLDAAIRLTPSRDGTAPLGDRAIPFHYAFKPTGDLFRNWSWPKARANRFDTIFSYALTGSAKNHPFLSRQDDQDFIRIEGIVGKPLGTAMGQLIQQKRSLGVSFAIEPVWIGYGLKTDTDAADAQLALAAIRRLLLCKMRDLDVIFLMIMAALFTFMVWIVQALGRLDATKTTTKKSGSGPVPQAGAVTAGIDRLTAVRSAAFLNLDRGGQVKLRETSDKVLTRVRKDKTVDANVVKILVTESAGDTPLQSVSVGTIYDKVRDTSIGGELVDRVRAAAKDLGTGQDADELAEAIYPSVSLMARAEEMMRVSSAASIAEFDEEKFGTAFRGFSDAYDNYAAKAETDAAKSTKDIAEVNTAVVGNQGLIAAAATQLTSTAITAELQKRLASMFQDLILPGYARKHPGLEHKAGVPVGGTFVLVYGTRRQIDAGLKNTLDDAGRISKDQFAKLVDSKLPSIDIERAIADILASSKPQSEDVLDEFVVLGDFCLPYLCCDADCSDVEIDKRILRKEDVVKPNAGTVTPAPTPEPAPTPRPTPAPTPTPTPTPNTTTTGLVEISVFQKSRIGREVAVRNAILVMTDLSTGRSSEQRLPEAVHTLELKPGKYGFIASSGAAKSASEEVALRAGATLQVRLVIG